jgi:phosphoglycolate phosphatase
VQSIICLDFDGTLNDVSTRYYKTYQIALHTVQSLCHGAEISSKNPMLTKAQFWRMKQSRVSDTEIAMRSGIDSLDIETFLACIRKTVDHPSLTHYDHPLPGSTQALCQLKQEGTRLILVTLRPQPQITQLLDQYGWGDFFDAVYGAQAGAEKPQDPIQFKTDLLIKALPSQGKAAQYTTWMIGDTEADIISGHSLGLSTVALTSGIRSQSFLRRLNPTQIHPNILSAINSITSPLLSSLAN